MASSFFLCLATILILSSMKPHCSEATEFWLGGNKENSWRLPTHYYEFNDWAEKQRFKVGDSLVFKYDPRADSVLRVDEEDYKICNQTNPIKTYNDGNTKFSFEESGPFFFISGATEHCMKGQKLEIKVLSNKHSSAAGGKPSSPPSQAPKRSPVVLTPPPAHTPVNAPANAPTASSAGMNVRVMDIFALVMAFLVAIAMV